MLFLFVFVGAALITFVLWRAMSATRDANPVALRRPEARPVGRPRRVSGPDDDPDFLRQLDENMQKRDDPPTG